MNGQKRSREQEKGAQMNRMDKLTDRDPQKPPIIGIENLVWVPNRIKGQHGIDALENVVNQLQAVDAAGGEYTDFVEILEDIGKIAASRK